MRKYDLIGLKRKMVKEGWRKKGENSDIKKLDTMVKLAYKLLFK
ncbi:hypothetical protein AALA24_11780 [Anaerovoracaceae bacterium 42-11]